MPTSLSIHRAWTLTLSSFAAALLAGHSLAGPLNPPAGPVAPTNKTLTEVEPRIALSQANTPGDASSFYRITQPGSYYLTGNVNVGTIEHGIQVDLNTEGLVTIDLNGFSLTGAEGTLNGIDVDGPFKPRVVLRNGFVMSFDGNGVDLVGAESVTVEKVESARNLGKGFVFDTGTISESKAQFNSAGGFQNSAKGIFRNCVALTTGPIGFKTGNYSILEGCTARGTTGNGFDCASFGVLTGCTAEDCGGHGFFTLNDSTLTNCTATSNSLAGIIVGTGSTLTGCTAAQNTTAGFVGSGRNVYQNCTAEQNGTSGFSSTTSQFHECVSALNTLDGFAIGMFSSISESSAISNKGHGIFVGGGSIIADCLASLNEKHGIYAVGDGNIIRGSNANGNGAGAFLGSGIQLDGKSNHVDKNMCDGNDNGIRVIGIRNIIVRNTCSNNPAANWFFVANNSYGPIIDRSAAATPAVNGDTAAAALGSTDPNANFTN